MKNIILSTLTVVTVLSTTAVADGYTLAPDGSYVSGDSYSLAPDGSYVSGDSYNLVPDGSFVGGGSYSMVWNAQSTATGIYLVRLEASGFEAVSRVLLVK